MTSLAIQPHGVLLALSEPELVVEHASINTLEHLGVAHDALLGRALDGVLFEDGKRQLSRALCHEDLADVNPLKLRSGSGEAVFDLVMHRTGGLLLVELEPGAAEPALGQLYRRVRNATARLCASHSIPELVALAARELRLLTGFDRVAVYRFHADGRAERIAEARADSCPESERWLCARSWQEGPAAHRTRVLVDARSDPVPVAGRRGEHCPPELADRATLRAALAPELAQLAQQGMRAALSVPLVVDDRPWGMLKCDHPSPRNAPYEVRQAAEFLAATLAWRIAARERSDLLERQAHARRLQARLVEQMSSHANPIEGLAADESAVLDFLEASGAVLSYEGVSVRLGRAPSADEVQHLTRWLSAAGVLDPQRGVFAAERLADEYPRAPPLSAAGVLVVAVEPEAGDFLLWFRDDARAWESFHIEPASELRGVILAGVQRRARELAALNEELRASNFAKDEFLATVSHELRTPLNAMLGWLHLLESGNLSDDKRRRALETVARSARTQAKLVEDLLDMSRITSGKLRLDVQPVQLAQVVEAAVETVRPALEAKGILLKMDLDRDAGPLLGDPQRLQQVVWNLLTNAVKFTPRHGHVGVELRRIDAYQVITVSDDGAGIPGEFLPHVFERFRQAEGGTRRIHKGLGLGLSIVKHLVELHGGQVSVTSRGERQGSTFTVRLPLASVPVRAAPQLTAGASGVEPPPELAGLRVLVVDDEADATDLLVAILSRCKVAVTAASSAMEALEQLSRASFDILVSDIGMPGMDGFDLVRRVRALPADQGGRMPAVALTAFTRPQDRARAFLAGFDVYLSKPLDASELVALLGNLAGRMGVTSGAERRDTWPPSAGEQAGVLAGVRTLLVDASEEGEPLARALREAGADVTMATSGREARAVAQRMRPELLVTAVELGDFDGYTLLRQLRASGAEEGGWIPAVALLRQESPDEARKALLAGFQLYVVRPLQLDVLLSRIARLVGWTVRRT